jgi:deoxyribonucleoside regulator
MCSTKGGAVVAKRGGPGDVRAMVRVAQMYYRMKLSQEQIGERVGLSRFQVGRMLDRALEEGIVRIEIVHPDARLIDLEEALCDHYRLRAAVVVDVPAAATDQGAQELAREAVAGAAAEYLAEQRPTGSIGVSWGRTMLELARQLRPDWTRAIEVVQLNGATSRSAVPTRANEIAERFGTTTGAAIRLLAAPAIVGSAELRMALEDDPAVGETLGAARRASTAVFGLGILTSDSVLVGSGYLTEQDLADLRQAGAVGDVVGRFLTPDGEIALPELDDRTVGLPVAELGGKAMSMGLAAGIGRGPITLAALRAGCLRVLVTDATTAEWVLAHG